MGGKPFTKGVSGNPGGRSKAHAAMARMIQSELGSDGGKLVAFALEVWRGAIPEMKTEKSRQWAHDWLSDRGFGKALQTVEVFGSGEALPDFSELSLDELRRIAAEGNETPPMDGDVARDDGPANCG